MKIRRRGKKELQGHKKHIIIKIAREKSKVCYWERGERIKHGQGERER